MRKFIATSLIMISLVSCGVFNTMPPDIAQAGKISHGFVEEVIEKYPQYRPSGMGGAFNSAINGFIIDFSTDEYISEEQAECEMVDIYQMLTTRINKDEKIRPYLSEWPFEGRLSDIGILFFDPKTRKSRKYPDLAVIGIAHGKMYKFYFYPPTDRLMTMEEIEEYEAKEHPEGEKGYKVWER